jgi:hypothetical protein
MITRREAIIGGAGLAAAGSVSAVSLAVDPDPVVILWHKLEAARKLVSEKSAHAEALHDAIPEAHRGAVWNLKVSVETPVAFQKNGDALIPTEYRTMDYTREALETLLDNGRDGIPEYKARLRDGLARLEGLEQEWHAARADYEAAEAETDRLYGVCDDIEAKITSTPATSPEGVACKLKLAIRQFGFFSPDDQPEPLRLTLKAAITDIETLAR